MSFDRHENLPGTLDPASIDDELWSLVASAATGTLDDQARKVLDKRLGEDDEALSFYVAYMRMHAQLGWASRSDDESRESGVGGHESANEELLSAAATHHSSLSAHHSPRRFRASHHKLSISIAVAVAVMTSGLATLHFMEISPFVASQSQKKGQGDKAPAELEFVASLTNWQNDQWLDNTRPRRRDPRLHVGKRLALAAGVVEITYHTGARVVLEGPAEYIVGRATGEDHGHHTPGGKPATEGPFVLPPPHNSGFLAYGKLIARVEGEDAKGFTVSTPTAQVEDLGTEFGVEVARGGESIVLVYNGEIRVKHASDETRILTRGQGTRATRESLGATGFSIDRSHFVRRILPTKVDLAAVVAGRAGINDAHVSRNNAVSFMEEQHLAHGAVNRYSAVSSNPIVDGVFIPDGGAAEEIVVSSTGVTVRGIEDSTGRFYGFVRGGTNALVKDVTLDGYDYHVGGRSLIGMHANRGITFDLNAVRRMLPESRINRFVAGAGNAAGSVSFYVLLDGKIAFELLKHGGEAKTLKVDVAVPETARFLTLIATDAGDGIHSDWAVFTEPQLRLSAKTGSRDDKGPTEDRDANDVTTRIAPE